MTIPFMTSVPRTYNPGKGRPREQLAFLSPDEIEMLLAMTDGRAEMTPHGLPSFADDSASSKGVSRSGNGATGSGSTKTANGSVSNRSSSNVGGGSQPSGGSNSGSRPSGTSTSWMSGNTPMYKVNPNPVVLKNESRVPEQSSSGKDQSRLDGGGSAVFSPDPTDKLYSDRVPQDTIQRVKGGNAMGIQPYSGIKHSAQTKPTRGLEVTVNGYAPADRSGDDHASVVSAGGEFDYAAADRSGDDFATRAGFGSVVPGRTSQPQESTARGGFGGSLYGGTASPQGSIVSSANEMDSEQRRMDEKNNSSFGGIFGDTLFRLMQRAKSNV